MSVTTIVNMQAHFTKGANLLDAFAEISELHWPSPSQHDVVEVMSQQSIWHGMICAISVIISCELW